jgi:hypothetical protein
MASLNLSDSSGSDQNRRFPSTPADREAIVEQLERLLAHPSFKHSRRYPTLLRYVVLRTLDGEGHVKERTLGTEVFGRDPDYDTNEDPVVRITAGEIRKRIAQYYHEAGHEGELRIDLPAGSYAPEFHVPMERPSHANGSGAHPAIPVSPPRSRFHVLFAKRSLMYCLIAVLAVGAVFGTARVKAWVSPKPIDEFWAPIVESPGPALVSIGSPSSLQKPPSPDLSVIDHIYEGDRICFYDVNALFRLAGLLGSRGKPARLQTSIATTLTDMRQGPVVLVAGFDNEWTMRVTQVLRYHFAMSNDRIFWIEDRENPSKRNWLVDFKEKYSQLTQDYAIVSRSSDPTTGQLVVVAAGIGENGTIAAGEFLTDAREMEDATRHAPKNWQTQNVEFVIASQVINEKSARPRVLATYYW